MWYLVTLSVLGLVQAATTTSSSDSSSSSSSTSQSTPVWVTGTNSAGITTVTQSPYTQKFTSMYSEVAVPSSGSIGLGSLSGKVGDVRTYTKVTLTNGANTKALRKVGAFGAGLAVIALL